MYPSENLLDTLTRLFPHGVTTTPDMAMRLREEGIGNIALSEVRILSELDGPQNIVIAHFDATHVTAELEVREGSRRDYEIAYCLNKSPNKLRFLVLSDYPESLLEPGKISPFDVARLEVAHFRSATFLIAEGVQRLADQGVNMILPKGSHGFEILPTSTVIEQIQYQLSDQWNIDIASGSPSYGLSEHI